MNFLFDGYLIVIFVYTIRLRKILKYHVWMDGGFRVDDTPVHRALREALANCVINTDFYGKQAIKTRNNQEKIRLYLQGNETAKTRDIAELLGLSMARTREILSVMDDVEAIGRNKIRIYRLRKES